MNNQERAKAAFEAITGFMDEAKLKYDCEPDKLVAFVTITGDDFPVTLMFSVSAEKQRVETYSQMPFEIKQDKGVDVATALAAVNSRIAYGKFCLYFDKGLCTYENSEYITGLGGFTPEYGKSLVGPAYSIIEEYNDKLYAINKGLLTVKDFTASLKK